MATQNSNERSMSPELTKEKQELLESLTQRAAAKDAIKDFNAAAELYSEATEIQAKLNGELSLDNADLLFAYGKALYNVAVSKSDVLGSKVAGNAPAQPSVADQTHSSVIENAIASGATKKDAKERNSKSENTENKPYFQFTGDENFDASNSEDDEDNAAASDGDDDDDDFANAFEVLDLARILYNKKLSSMEEECEKSKSTTPDPNTQKLKERLADTYDLQAEISLEGERFMDAVSDLKITLELRQSLFPMEDPSIAECHYKLSLALEFGSVAPGDEDSGGGINYHPKVDEEMRKEAVLHTEKAIESCQLRLTQEQMKLDNDSSLDEDKKTATKRKIANVREIIIDMEQRLVDLRRLPIPIDPGSDDDSDTMLRGILKQILGQPPGEQQSKLDAATKNANDLSALIKRKPAATQSSSQANSASKRSATEEMEELGAKKARSG